MFILIIEIPSIFKENKMVNFIAELTAQDITANKVRKLHTRSFKAQLKDSIFEAFNTYFKPKYRYKMKHSVQMFLEILINSIYCLQLLTLVLHPGVDIAGWDHYTLVWYIIGCFRFDNICADLGVLDFCFYSSVGMILVGFLTLCVTVFMCYMKYSIPGNLAYFPGKLLEFLPTIGYLPILMINLIVIKYSFNPDAKIDEYNSNRYLDLSPVSALWGVIGIFCAILVYLLAVIHELFSADICHSFAERNIRAKADTGIDIKVLEHKTAIAVIYVFAGIANITIYHLYIMISTGILSYLMFKCSSYFNPFVDALKISVILGISIFDAFFLLALWTNAAGVVVLLSVVILPLIFLVLLNYISKLSKSYANSRKAIIDQHSFELNMRHMLIDRTGVFNGKVVDKFIEVYKSQLFPVQKLMVAWEVNYFIHSIKDIDLARIKFARMTYAKHSLDGEIQEWRIKKSLDCNMDNYSIESDFLFYLIDYEEVEKDDEKLCLRLLALWNEITCKKPRLKKLENSAHKVSKLIEKLRNKYMSLITYKHAKAYEMYGTFLTNILNENQFGNLILNKRNTFISNADSKNERRLMKFDDENGIILISANKEDFGDIVYINQKAAEALEENIHSATGNKIWQYIPKPYQSPHPNYMKSYVENCKSTDLPTPNSLFFLNQMGFLLECHILVRLTAFNGHLYFMATLKLVQSLRQVALISENGYIYAHSSHFLEYLSLKKNLNRCQWIQELIPDINFQSLQIYEPEIISPRGIDIAVVHCIKNYLSSQIHYVLLITDPVEIKQWCKGLDYNQLEYYKRAEAATETDNFNISVEITKAPKDIPIKKRVHLTHEETTELSNTLELSRIDEIAKKRKLSHIDDRSLTASILQSNSTSVAKSRGKSVIIKSEGSLKKFKWILLISMIVVIATNIAISAYISQAVSHSKSFNSFKDLAIILYRLTSFAEISRSIYFSLYSSIDFDKNIALMNEAIDEMTIYHQSLFDNLHEWSYCSSSKIVRNNIMSAWTGESPQTVYYTNLLDEIQNSINTANQLVVKATRSDNFDDEMRFLVSNGLQNIYKRTNSSLAELSDCEMQRILDNSNIITILLVVGLCISGLCTIVLVYYIFSISNKYNILWNFIKKITHLSYFELKRCCLERLCSVHGNDYNQEEIDAVYRNKPPDDKLRFRENLKFILRLCIFLLITTLYYISVHAILYVKCEELLRERPKLLANYIRRRALVPRIDFWARETALYESSISLKILFSESIIFNSPNENLNDAISLLKSRNAQLREFMSYMPYSFKENLYEHSEQSLEYDYGGAWVNNLLGFDSLRLAHSEDDIMEDVMELTSQFAVMQQYMKTNFDIINKSSENMISEVLDYIIDLVVAYTIISLMLYLFYYLPYLSSEIKRLYKLQLIIAIIPKT